MDALLGDFKQIGEIAHPVISRVGKSVPGTTMQANATRTQKHIATEHCFDAWCVGIDADGAAHFWSQYFETLVVVDGTDAEVFELDATPLDTLDDWKRHVANQRGWTDCRIGGSLIGDLAEATQ